MSTDASLLFFCHGRSRRDRAASARFSLRTCPGTIKALSRRYFISSCVSLTRVSMREGEGRVKSGHDVRCDMKALIALSIVSDRLLNHGVAQDVALKDVLAVLGVESYRQPRGNPAARRRHGGQRTGAPRLAPLATW